MIPRLLIFPKSHSFFLFGARNTGKSTWVSMSFKQESCFWIDLLDPAEESVYSLSPKRLEERVSALDDSVKYVVIDEIQKIPQLLDVVHRLIESTDKLFILIGSSARKLKRGSANLLAGRAFSYHFFPFSFLELGDQFNLDVAINYGLLPKIYNLEDDALRQRFLITYTHTYLKEEIIAEQVVRKLNAFRKFLEVAAQQNGKVINHSSIAKDTGVALSTVQEYYQILEDTLVGFYLEPYHTSIRKRISKKPKFYFFDLGVVKALNNTLKVPTVPRTHAYGDAFEHLVILECMKLSSIYFLQYRFSYILTKEGAEVDLVVERPGEKLLLIEIKSSEQVDFDKLSNLKKFAADIDHCEAICLSNDSLPRSKDGITIYPWQAGIKKFFKPDAL